MCRDDCAIDLGFSGCRFTALHISLCEKWLSPVQEGMESAKNRVSKARSMGRKALARISSYLVSINSLACHLLAMFIDDDPV